MPRIALASYNIHSGVGLDGRRVPARTAAVLKALECDIYALQEVHNEPWHDGSRQLDDLAAELGVTAIPGLGLTKARAEYGNALLTRLPVLDSCRIDLSVPGREPRGALEVVLALGSTRPHVWATHLGLRRRERRLQWARLLERVARAPPGEPLVLLGDMNEWYPRAAPLQAVHRVFGETRAPRAFPSWAPALRLTRIWVRPAAALVSIERGRGARVRVTSDHLPVKAVVELGKR